MIALALLIICLLAVPEADALNEGMMKKKREIGGGKKVGSLEGDYGSCTWEEAQFIDCAKRSCSPCQTDGCDDCASRREACRSQCSAYPPSQCRLWPDDTHDGRCAADVGCPCQQRWTRAMSRADVCVVNSRDVSQLSVLDCCQSCPGPYEPGPASEYAFVFKTHTNYYCSIGSGAFPVNVPINRDQYNVCFAILRGKAIEIGSCTNSEEGQRCPELKEK